MNLNFNVLREANSARLPQFRNKHGQLAHSQPDGSDWTPAQWLQAMIGELGEYANNRKKFERGDLSFYEFHLLAAKELADVQTYLDLLARRALDSTVTIQTPEGVAYLHIAHPTGVDLGLAVVEKFNEISVRAGSSVRIIQDGAGWTP